MSARKIRLVKKQRLVKNGYKGFEPWEDKVLNDEYSRRKNPQELIRD